MKILANRVLSAFSSWDERRKELETLLRAGNTDEHTIRRLQLQHLRQASHRLRDTIRPDEQPFAILLKRHIEKLEKRLYPNWLLRLISRVKDRFVDGPIYLRKQQELRKSNMESLKWQIRDKGFTGLSGKLDEHLDPDLKTIVLPLDCKLDQDKRLKFDLHFAKDAYGYFQLHRLDGSLLKQNEVVGSHRFDLTDWPDLKVNQAWNLLEGRALKQTYLDSFGHANERWVELGQDGLQHYDSKHAFDVKTVLDAFPAITRNKEELTSALENGQRVSTHWKQNGQLQSIQVQADPARRTLKFFDEKNRHITPEKLRQNAQQRTAKVITLDAQKQQSKRRIKNGQHI